MSRIATIVALIGALIGLGAGYLWWGLSQQRLRSELGDTRARLETLEKQQQAGPTARPDEVKGQEERIKALEAELERERQMRSRLETVISEGRK
jgi:hypothetical protein